MKIEYVGKGFSDAHLEIIGRAQDICDAMADDGFTLTLRQLFYQFVTNGWLPNAQNEYKRLGEIVNAARLAGLIDWEHMEDRVRNVDELPHWDDPPDFLRRAHQWFRHDQWDNQESRPFQLLEKDALAGVIQPTCHQFRVPYLACRGYMSQSEMWRLAQRIGEWQDAGQRVVVYHLGDHDPSGIDMTRDNEERLNLFLTGDGHEAVAVERLALNMDQVRKFKPPPNPAKTTDSRHSGYLAKFGKSSWELDALQPKFIANLLEGAFQSLIDSDLWQENVERETKAKTWMQGELAKVSKRWKP